LATDEINIGQVIAKPDIEKVSMHCDLPNLLRRIFKTILLGCTVEACHSSLCKN
jgi:hypothetical protein